MRNDAQHAETVRLYGLPHAERMYLDVASLYESEIDPDFDPDCDHRTHEWTVEEWSVADPLTLITQANWFLEKIEESLCEAHTHDNDDCHHIFTHPDVLAAAQHLREVIASKVTWQQAEALVAEHKLTVVGDEPYFDGGPVYRTAHIDGDDRG